MDGQGVDGAAEASPREVVSKTGEEDEGGGVVVTTIMVVGFITCRPVAAAVVKYWPPRIGKDPDLSNPTCPTERICQLDEIANV